VDDISPEPSGLQVAPGVFVPRSALRFGYCRSSGPGGQSVNKLSTKVRLHIHLRALTVLSFAAKARLRKAAGSGITEDDTLVIASDGSRSQRVNKQACLDKLWALIERSMKVPKRRRATKPSAGSRRRRLEGKKRRSQTKQSRKSPRDDG
jgi:ribosome-associated protein